MRRSAHFTHTLAKKLPFEGLRHSHASPLLRSKQKGPLSSHFLKNKKTIHTHSFAQWDVYGAFTCANKCAGFTVTQVKKMKELKKDAVKRGQERDAGAHLKKIKRLREKTKQSL